MKRRTIIALTLLSLVASCETAESAPQSPTKDKAGPVAAKKQRSSLSVTKVVIQEGRYATTQGYPATSKKVYELTRKNHPDGAKAYDALIKRVLFDTQYLGQVPLGEYISATLTDQDKAQAIDTKGPKDRGQRAGSGRTFSFYLLVNETSSYRFRDDLWKSEVYSGDAVRELQKVVTATKPVEERTYSRRSRKGPLSPPRP